MGDFDGFTPPSWEEFQAAKPRFWCLRCGARWVAPVAFGTEHGFLAGPLTMKCPECLNPVTSLANRPQIAVSTVTALRDAGLSDAEMVDVDAVIQSAPAGISPRQLAEKLPPAMTPVVTAASRFGAGNWLTALGLVVTIALGAMNLDASRDAERSRHTDAVEALRRADEARPIQSTSDLTDADIAEISRRVNAYLDAKSAKPSKETKGKDTAQRKAGGGDR